MESSSISHFDHVSLSNEQIHHTLYESNAPPRKQRDHLFDPACLKNINYSPKLERGSGTNNCK